MTPYTLPPDVLDRYLIGEATASERTQIEAWLAERPWRAQALDALRDGGEPPIPSVDVEAVAHRIEDCIASEQRHPRRSHERSTMRIQMGWSMGVALAVAAAVFGIRTIRAPQPPAQFHTYATHAEQRATIRLTDGTRIQLAPSTTIRIRDSQVDLMGEALFEVASQHAAPLTVRTGLVTTRVLGTAFDVQRYAADQTTRVIVVSGRVATGAVKMVALPAGAMAQVTDSGATVLYPADLSLYTAWTKGRLLFNGVTAQEMLTTVGHWYGYRFRLADSTLAAQRVSAEFTGRAPQEVLQALQSLLDVSMTFEDTVVTLRPRHGAASTSRTRQMAPAVRGTLLEVGR